MDKKCLLVDKSYIKIIINQCQVFHKEKNILPYTLYLQLDNFEVKKIKTINNTNEVLESPSNEFIFELTLSEKEKDEELFGYILNFNAYTTSIFFIQKNIASIKIPIFINKAYNGKQWYILKDNKEEACIKLLLNIEVHISNNSYNNINQNIYTKDNNSFKRMNLEKIKLIKI